MEESRIISSLNEEQKIASTTYQGPLLVLAGAGTGKTKVITSRIAYILSNNIATSENIMAVTFTNKAANEMKERLTHMGFSTHSMFIGTFHSICVKILRPHAVAVGLTSNFVILDEDDQLKIIKEIMQEKNLDTKETTPKNLASRISYYKSIKDFSLSPFDKNIGLKDIISSYQQRLSTLNAVDFDDIILKTIDLLTNNEKIRSYYQEQLHYILVDEFQDTNYPQYQLIKLLGSKFKNICCVGDDDQAIYSWRGSDIEHILSFPKDFPGTRTIKLEQNYRSTPQILKASSNLISNNSKRNDKTLWTQIKPGEAVKLVLNDSDKHEASFIAGKIDKYASNSISSPYKASEVAILVRALYQTRILEECLIARGIAYRIIGGIKFYERKEIKDIVCYIRLIMNENDDLAFERIINAPKRGIGESSLQKMKSFARAKSMSLLKASQILAPTGKPQIAEAVSPAPVFDLFGVLQEEPKKTVVPTNTTDISVPEEFRLPPKAIAALKDFVSTIEELTKSLTDVSISSLVQMIIDRTGYMKALKDSGLPEDEARIENIREFLNIVSDFYSFEELLEHVALATSTDKNADETIEQISIMSVHAAKGLEFKVVFIPGFEEGIFPHYRSMDNGDENALEEERRLAYVAITRAREKLYISSCRSRFSFGSFEASTPSRFIKEIGQDDLDIIDKSYEQQVKKDNYFEDLEDGLKSTFFNSRSEQEESRKTVFSFFGGNKEKKKPAPSYKFQKGDTVRHVKFGKGSVVKVNDLFLEVNFEVDNQQRSIRQDFLQLEK